MGLPHLRSGRRLGVVLAAAAATVASAVTFSGAGGAGASTPSSLTHPLSRAPLAGQFIDFGCAQPKTTHLMGCFGKVLAHRSPSGLLGPDTMTQVTGYGPADIRSAYNLAGKSGKGRTVAIVDAHNDPNAEADLAAYRSHFKLPPCTKANGCFKQVNQNGATSPLPTTDYGWALEISLDLDMVSATCPSCKILLVEANTPTNASLYKAVDTAANTPGVIAVSNSYGGSESAAQTTSGDPHYHHPGVAITASSGDSGYGASYPAASKYVTAVGGTSLTKASNARGWTETAWDGAGSGCSSYDAKPAWQHDADCAKRTIADVSAVADPNTGVAVYDTANPCGHSATCDTLIEAGLVPGADGWVQVGGTSASSPIIASVFALAGTTAPSLPYKHPSALNDVTSGSNGSCGGSYLCTAGPGYDGPTGLGTPNGTGAF